MPCILSGTNVVEGRYDTVNSGVDYYMLQFMRNYFNFTYDVIDGHLEFGTKLDNGSFSGVVGMTNRSVRSR